MPISYSGLSQIGTWNMNDVDQIQRGLTICICSADIGMSRIREDEWTPPSLRGLPDLDKPTYMEYMIYQAVLRAVSDFLDDKEVFCNPPVRFFVEGKEAYITFLPEGHKDEMLRKIKEYVAVRVGEKWKNIYKVSMIR